MARWTRKRDRRKREQGIIGVPTQPGWYVQWAGRDDWFPMDESSARLLAKTIVADGDRVMQVTASDAGAERREG